MRQDRKSFTRMSAVAAVSLIAAAACGGASSGGSGSSASSQEPYRVLAVLGLSGPAASLSQAEVQALKAGASVINAHGGVNGRQMQVEAIDDQGDASKAVSLLQNKLSSGTKPDLVWPGTNSDEGSAMVPILNQAGILSVGDIGTADFTTSKYPLYFNGPPMASSIAKVLVSHLQSMGVKTLGMLYADDAYGQTSAGATKAAASAAGLEVVTATYKPTALDMTSQLQSLKSKSPDAVWVEAVGAPGGYVLKSRLKLGWDVPVVGDVTLGSAPLTTLVPAAALKGVSLQVYKVQEYMDPADRPANLAALITSVKAQGSITIPMDLYSFSYDLEQLVAAAANQANSTTATEIAKALESLTAPANPPWTTFDCYCYSSSSHFPKGADTDYAFVAPGPVVDGQIKSQ